MEKINIKIKDINFDEEINKNKKLLKKYEKMKKDKISIPTINGIPADEVLIKQNSELEKKKKDKIKK